MSRSVASPPPAAAAAAAAASVILVLVSVFVATATAASAGAAPDDDVLGLIAFKSGVADPGGTLASWDADADRPCGWTGVTCDGSSGRAAALSLPGARLSGRLGRGLLRLAGLRSLDLSGNALLGSLPDDFFVQCHALRDVNLAGNAFSGQIPDNIGGCATLVSLNLSSNQLTGPLPAGLWSLSKLQTLDLSGNALTGAIPDGIGHASSLTFISLHGNQINSKLPDDLGNCWTLESVDFGSNSITGSLPESLRKLTACRSLDLSQNGITGELPVWIGEMAALETLHVSGNQLSGELPKTLGDLKSLKQLWLARNGLSGTVPEAISGCSSLFDVDLSLNSLSGYLPDWVFGAGFQRVSLAGNKLAGSIWVPANARSGVQAVDLSSNGFSGDIPDAVAQLQGLQWVNLSWNSLSGGVPASLLELKSLQVLDMSANQLTGIIAASICKEDGPALTDLRLGMNSLTGVIPAQIGNCRRLTSLNLSKNNLTGSIPVALANLTELKSVNLSCNKLAGALPKQLADLPHLQAFDVSHNFLTGDLPPGGFFNTIPPSLIADNPGLCGSAPNSSCASVLPKPIVMNPNSTAGANALSPATSSPASLQHKKIILSISALVAIGAAAAITIGVITITILNLRVRPTASGSAHSAAPLALDDGYHSQSPTTDVKSGKLVMFGLADPEFSASAHAILNKDCELGRGGFGTVYRTSLRDGQPVAIKKLTVSSLVKSQDEFEREVKMLGKLRHRNLVALKGYYWTQSLQLLIYEFVPGGNLQRRLHEQSAGAAEPLSWKDRFDIIVGIAKSLAHLHRHGIIHYNLKSTNVLLDESGEAKVGDYGLAKLLPMLDRYVISSKVQSALGYMAPEFVCRTVQITDKCDVYGFGVLVLEILTGRKPVEYMEDDVVMVCDLARAALDDGRVEECVDQRLAGKFPTEEAVPLLKLGLVCTSQVPASRPDMIEVVSILELIRCPHDSPDAELG